MRERGRRQDSTARGIALAAACLTTAACGPQGGGPRRILAQEVVLERQIAGLRQLVARAEAGSLLPRGALVVAVDEGLVQRLAQLALPREEVIDGQYRVRLERVEVRFRDKWGSVRLDGRVSPANRSADEVFAEVAVFGHMDAVDLDAESGMLEGRVSVIGFELKKLGVFGESETGRRLLESLAEERAESLAGLAFPIRFPIQLERDIELPGASEGPVRLASARFPLKVTVADVSAHGGRLWVALEAEAGAWTRVEEADARASEARR